MKDDFYRIDSAKTKITVNSIIKAGAGATKGMQKYIRNLPGYVDGDAVGRMIGTQLGGPEGEGFVFPIGQTPNNQMLVIENRIASIAGAGKAVNLKVRLSYQSADTARPRRIDIHFNYKDLKGSPQHYHKIIYNN